MKNKPAILEGKKTRTTIIKPRKTMDSEEIDAVKKVMQSDNLSTFIAAPGINFLGGKNVKDFENNWKEMYGFQHAISVNSWTSGLIIAVGAIGIEPGDEVICSPYTMSASATSVLFYGGIPVFADISSTDYNINPKSIEEKITSRTQAIIVVHIFGGIADMDGIMKIAKKYNLKVIEDCAQSPGAYYKGNPVGAIGDIGGFSLNFHKHIDCGEGGMHVTNNKNLAFKSQLIRNHGENYAEKINKNELYNIIGGNYRLSEIHAAIGIQQLKKLEKIKEHRIKLADFLHNEIKKIEGLTTFPNEDGVDHVYYLFPIRYDKKIVGLSRNLFVKSVNKEFLDANGWESVPLTEGYVKPLYLNPIYQQKIAIGKKGFPFNFNKGVEYDYSMGTCPNVEKAYFEELIITPLVREPLTISVMKDLITAIKKVIKNSKEIAKAFPDNSETQITTPVSISSSGNVR